MSLEISGDGTFKRGGNEAIEITASGIPLLNVPAFRAYLGTTQSISDGVPTKVNIDTKTGTGFFDTNDWFDTTNNRYIPQIAGYYFFTGLVRLTGTSQTAQACYFYKNGSIYQTGSISRVSTSAPTHLTISTMAYMDGSTDYMELWGFTTATSPAFNSTAPTNTSVFEGFLVRNA